jgi:membrane protein DedA with SNARE-associated domain
MNLALFFVLSLITRTIRFMGVAALIYFFGEPVRLAIEKYLEWVLVGFLVVIVSGYFIARYMFH